MQILPRGDRVLLATMDTGHPDHADGFDVFHLDAKVGAPDGDGDSSPQGAITRDDLDGKVQWWGVGCVFL